MREGGQATGHPLDAVFLPRSVAVVGASGDPRKRGYQVLRALEEGGYAGRVIPVNPKGGEILGRRVEPSLSALDEPPDLALLCTPAGTIPALVEECGRAGVRAAVVLAVGFGESGEAGEELEARLREAAREGGVRVVGPNTSGIFATETGLNLIGARGVRAGGVALLVQSGNMALALMNELTARGTEGVSVVVGVGNQADLQFADYLEFLEAHGGTRAVIAYVEGLREGPRFLRVAARVARRKPVLLIKGARSGRGKAAARSHTGAVSGEHDLLRAALRQAGVVEVTRTDELAPLAETFARQPAPAPGTGVVILSDGGGQGTLAVDTLSEMGADLAELAPATEEALRALLGSAASVRNPVDLAGAADADPMVFARALRLIADDAGAGTVLLVGLFGGYGIRFADVLAAAEAEAAADMADRMRSVGLPLVVHTMYAGYDSAALAHLRRAGVPVVASLEVACRCATEIQRRGAFLARPPWGGPGEPPRSPSARSPVLAEARRERRTALTEPEARELLTGMGLPLPPGLLCRSAADVDAAVGQMPGPIAMKVVAPAMPHKTDAGGVALGVRGREEAVRTFAALMARARAHLAARGGEVRVDGVLVTPMLEAPRLELLVGARRDAEVGPALTVGAGGVWVEQVRDVAHRILPVSDDDIATMLRELRAYGLMAAGRGRPAVDLAPVIGAVRAVADCLWTMVDVAEVEVNPLFVYEDHVWGVDARVFLGP